MGNVTYKTRPLGYPGDARVPYAWAGWNDALAGRPMDYNRIDRAPSIACAHAYETARLRVLVLRNSGLPVPPWHSMKSVPKAIQAALALTNSLQVMARAEGNPYWPTGPNHWKAAA